MKRDKLSYFEYMRSIGKPLPDRIVLMHTEKASELSTTTEVGAKGNLQKISIDPGPYPHGFKEKVKPPRFDPTPVVQSEEAVPVIGKPGRVRVRPFPGAETYVEVDLW